MKRLVIPLKGIMSYKVVLVEYDRARGPVLNTVYWFTIVMIVLEAGSGLFSDDIQARTNQM